MPRNTAPIVNSFVNPEYDQYPKIFDIFVKLISIFLGLDFGFIRVQSQILKKCLKIFYLAYSLTICVACFFCFYFITTKVNTLWYSLYLCAYILLSIILLLSKNSLYVLHKELSLIDWHLKVQSVPFKVYNTFVVLETFLIFCRISVAYVYCSYYPTYCIDHKVASIIYIVAIIAIDLISAVYFFVFYLLYCHLRKFTELVNIYHKTVSDLHHLYKSKIDCAEKGMETLERIFSMVLIFITPNIMMAVFFTLKEIQNKVNEQGEIHLVGYVVTFLGLVLILAPAMSAGMLSSQCEKLKLLLHEKLLTETSRNEARHIKRFVRYIDVRPFRFYVLKIIVMDWTFPVVMLNLLITYLIVIIQFTHTY